MQSLRSGRSLPDSLGILTNFCDSKRRGIHPKVQAIPVKPGAYFKVLGFLNSSEQTIETIYLFNNRNLKDQPELPYKNFQIEMN